ncbi:carbohydrate kinase family protein [Streptomyces sp. IBSBF 2435]|uniref:carbohydrate kinase family protein n=1 Tax=Streptomyces sp. IBSBF 2435 TaxID=2903531 RepID=UPI002FDBE58F
MSDGPGAAPPAVVIGEALTDVLVDSGGRRRGLPGGSPANVALGLGRLGHPVRFATRIGRDTNGDQLRRRLRDGGVLLAPGSVTERPTSTATALLDGSGSAAYDFDIAWAPSRQAVETVRTGPPAHLHTGSIATALPPGADAVFDAVGRAQESATTSYDPNLRPALLGPPGRERARVEQLVEVSDVVKASAEDLDWLYPGQGAERAAQRWATAGPAMVVLTLGDRGARAWWRHGSYRVPPVPVRVADTVGAGDAFMSCLVSSLLRAGLLGGSPACREALAAATDAALLPPPIVAALSLASRAAALTCGREGADPPTRKELTSLF